MYTVTCFWTDELVSSYPDTSIQRNASKEGLLVMTTAQELRDKLAETRELFMAAMRNSSDSWEMGESSNWGARRISEHVIENENYFANAVASALEASAVHPIEINAITVEIGLETFVQVTEDTNRVYGYIEDGDIKKPAQFLAGQGFEPTIGGAVDFATWHLLDHVKQLETLPAG
jgi:hypothetical protein